MLIFELLSHIYIYSASIGLGDNVLSNTLWLTGLSYSRYVFFFLLFFGEYLVGGKSSFRYCSDDYKASCDGSSG